MQLNDAGRVVAECWLGIPDHFSGVELDADVVMPNHFHGIIIVGARHAVPLPITSPPERFGKPVTGSIPTILRSFKSAVTKGINELYGTPGATIWQRNYYEHIIRHDESLNRIRQYINDNPLQWALDRENPTCNNSEILVGANPSVCTQKDEPWRI
jgi:REP element-mobilizing transposase RayT